MQRTYSLFIFGVPFLLGTVLVGCNQSVPTTPIGDSTSATNANVSPKTVNAVCPIMGGKVAVDGGTAEWDGKLVGFCCPGCEPEWAKLSDDAKGRKLVAANGNRGDEDIDADHDHS